MTKEEKFVMLVQTAAIVESISRGKELHGEGKEPSLTSKARIAVHAAMRVPEEKIPDDLSEACEKLIRHVFDYTIPKPSWLQPII